MRAANAIIDCWPTRQQELLLQAALLQGKHAVSAWERWNLSTDIERLDPGSHNLLPLLYYNLSTLGIGDPSMDRFKGVYRQTWYKNQLSLHEMSVLLDAFQNVGIRTMLLKGAALILLYYKDHGLRPMGDIDILVPTERAHEAIDLMVYLGWRPVHRFPKRLVHVLHSADFESPSGNARIDLHWHVLQQRLQSDVDDKFWEGAVPLRVDSILTCALNSTDQLLHILAHGIRWNPHIPPLRWVADSMILLNHPKSQIDWERLVWGVRAFRLILPVRNGLEFLRNKLGTPIPAVVFQSLNNMRTTTMERIEYNYRTQAYISKLLGQWPLAWFDYSRLKGNEPLPLKLVGFVKYIKSTWGAESVRELVSNAAFCATRKLRRFMALRSGG